MTTRPRCLRCIAANCQARTLFGGHTLCGGMGRPMGRMAADTACTRLSLALCLGSALFVDTKSAPIMQASRAAGQQWIAGALGVNLSRHWGVEVVANGDETRLELSGVGTIGEYAVRLVPSPDRHPTVAVEATGLVPGAVGPAGVVCIKARGETFSRRHGRTWMIAVEVAGGRWSPRPRAVAPLAMGRRRARRPKPPTSDSLSGWRRPMEGVRGFQLTGSASAR
jgi:hypothetical protein